MSGITSMEQGVVDQSGFVELADPLVLASQLTQQISIVRDKLGGFKNEEANKRFVDDFEYQLTNHLNVGNPNVEDINTSMGKAYGAYLLMKDSPLINKGESAQIMAGIMYLISMGIIHVGAEGVSIPVLADAWKTITALRQVLLDLKQLKEELTPKVVTPLQYTPFLIDTKRRTATEAQELLRLQTSSMANMTGLYHQMIGQLFNKNADENKTPGSP